VDTSLKRTGLVNVSRQNLNPRAKAVYVPLPAHPWGIKRGLFHPS
jgi:hypothetical protein